MNLTSMTMSETTPQIIWTVVLHAHKFHKQFKLYDLCMYTYMANV